MRTVISILMLASFASITPAKAASVRSDQLMDLVKKVDKTKARPGDMLTYTMRFTNISDKPLTDVVISDTVPNLTVYVSATCVEPLPMGVETCSVYTNNPASPTAVRWEYAEPLAPGQTGEVVLKVRVRGGTI